MPVKSHTHSLQRLQKRAGIFFIFPLLLGILFILIPNLFMTFQFSLNDIVIQGDKGYTLVSKGFKYYVYALRSDANFIPDLVLSYQKMLVDVPVILIFSIFIANLLNQKFHGRGIARAVFFIPILLSTGIFDAIEAATQTSMGSLSITTGSSIDSMMSFNAADLLNNINFNPVLIGIVKSAIANIYQILKLSGMQIFIFLAGLQEIPDYMYEAAEVEGCSKWESFWKITFPMLIPQMMVNFVYTIVDSGQGGDVLGYANQICNVQGNYGLGTAMIILYLLTLAVLLAIVFWIFARLTRNRY